MQNPPWDLCGTCKKEGFELGQDAGMPLAPGQDAGDEESPTEKEAEDSLTALEPR